MAGSKTLLELYTDNPTTTLNDEDLMYVLNTPYGDTNNSGIAWSSLYTNIINNIADSNLKANSFITGYEALETSNLLRILSAQSTQTLYFTGTAAQTIRMPVVSTLEIGQYFIIINESDAAITIVSSGSSFICEIPVNMSMKLMCIAVTGTDQSSWEYSFNGWNLNANLNANNFIAGYSTNVTTGGTTTLTIQSAQQQEFTGTLGQTVVMPVVSTLDVGIVYYILNSSTQSIVVNSSGGNLIVTVSPNEEIKLTCISLSGTDASSWQYQINSFKAPLPIALGGTGVESVTTSPTANAFVGWDGSKNIKANNFIEGYEGTVTTEGTTLLTIASPELQYFFGTLTQGVIFPLVSTLTLGHSFTITNLSTESIVLYSSGLNIITSVLSNTSVKVTCISTFGTTASSWNYEVLGFKYPLPIALGGTGVTSVTTAPTASSFAGWDTNSNISANNVIEGYQTTVTSNATTHLTVASAKQQYFTGSNTQAVVMPVVSTLVLGQAFVITNLSSDQVFVYSSGEDEITTLSTNASAEITCISTSGTGASSWFTGVTGGGDFPISLSNGGTGASLTPSNGAIVYCGASTFALLNAPASARHVLLSGASAAPSWSTAKYPSSASPGGTENAGNILMTVADSEFATSTATYPASAGTANTILISDGTNFKNTDITYPTSANTAGTIIISNGTNFVNSTTTYPNVAGSNGTVLMSQAGAMVTSTASYPQTAGTSGTLLTSNGTNFVNTTATYPTSTTANRILYSSSDNVVGEISTSGGGVIVTNSSGVPECLGGMGNGELIIGYDGGTPSIARLTGGIGIHIASGFGSCTISATGSTPTETLLGSASLEANKRYIVDSPTLASLALPTSDCPAGSEIHIVGKGTGLLTVTQGSGQSINRGNTSTTVGASGSVSTSGRYDTFRLVCIEDDKTFNMYGCESTTLSIV